MRKFRKQLKFYEITLTEKENNKNSKQRVSSFGRFFHRNRHHILYSLLLLLIVLQMPPVQKFLNIGQHSASTEQRDGDISGKPRIIDGDTIEISGTRIRLHGIDAPESAQRCEDADGNEWSCGKKATSALKGKIGWLASVSCEKKDTDRYGRMVAVCYLDGEDLNEWMVQNGWAVAYRHYSSDYASAEREAKYADRGIWAGRFEKPEDWRKKH